MKLLLASDLHYITNLAEEIAVNRHRLPADTYNHRIDGKLFWHNQMLVEEGERLLDRLEALARQEAPDLLLFLGDLVNTNWEANVEAVGARMRAFPIPVRQVTGNHDIYLGGVEHRLQEAVTPGTFHSGLRHEIVEGLGLLYLDLFVHGSNGDFRKWLDPQSGERVNYRPADVEAALELMQRHPDTPWLIFGHFPFASPDPRIDLPGHKMGRAWPATAEIAAYLQHPNNLLGIVCGHQHFAHFQRFDHGFHWTLPAMVEYPCAAALVEWDGKGLRGRIVELDAELADRSLHPHHETWPAGEAMDRHFVWPSAAA